jgi:peptide/nickel transport system substrate-binding protein
MTGSEAGPVGPTPQKPGLAQVCLSRRRLLQMVGSAALLGAGGLVAASCSSAPARSATRAKLLAPPGPVGKISLTGGQIGYPSPFAYFQGGGFDLTTFVFDSLIWHDSERYLPWLASSWSVAPDGLSWTFTMRDHVLWHDGRPLTASDVAFTVEYLKSLTPEQANIIPGPLDFIGSVTTKGQTVTFAFPEPYAPFEVTCQQIQIIPEHIWKNVTSPEHDLSPNAVMGSGPYMLTSYDETQGTYRFERNPAYFLGSPVVEALDFVPSSNPLVSLRVGQIDGGSPGAEDGIPTSVLDAFTSDPRFSVISGYGGLTRALFFNMRKGFPYNDVRFRQAIAYGIDRKALVERILYGQGVPGSLGNLSPANPWFAPGLPTYPYDPSRASQLLDQIGLKKDSAGVRRMPDGSTFAPVIYTSSADRAETASLVLDDVRALGIDASVVSLDPLTANATSSSGRYEMMLIFYGGIIGDPEELQSWFAPGVKIYSFVRVHGYDNQRFATLAAEQLHELDVAKRMALVHEMQHILAEDVPILQLYVPNNTWIYRTDVFDAWYFTPGGVFGGNPTTLNKQAFVTGKKTGV